MLLPLLARRLPPSSSLSPFESFQLGRRLETRQTRHNSKLYSRVLSPAVVDRPAERLSFQRGEPERRTAPDEPKNANLRDAKVRPQVLRPYLEPLPVIQKEDPFGFEQSITVERLFKAKVHYGHKIGTLDENMKWALYGERLGVCVFDLDITRNYMVRALNFLATLSYAGGRVLFITTQKQAMLLVEEVATELGDFSHTRFWYPGTLNNKATAGGPVRLPDTIIFLNVLTTQLLHRHPAIVEAAKMCIPSIGIIDSNCKPNLISYPIPGNDDSIDSIEFYMKMFAKAIRLGREHREKTMQKLEPAGTEKWGRGGRQQQQPQLQRGEREVFGQDGRGGEGGGSWRNAPKRKGTNNRGG